MSVCDTLSCSEMKMPISDGEAAAGDLFPLLQLHPYPASSAEFPWQVWEPKQVLCGVQRHDRLKRIVRQLADNLSSVEAGK